MTVDLLKETALRALASEVCVCNAPKNRKQSFCRVCYLALPSELRQELWRAMADGYPEHYGAARDWLQKDMRQASLF